MLPLSGEHPVSYKHICMCIKNESCNHIHTHTHIHTTACLYVQLGTMNITYVRPKDICMILKTVRSRARIVHCSDVRFVFVRILYTYIYASSSVCSTG